MFNSFKCKLTLVFGMPVSKGKVNRSHNATILCKIDLVYVWAVRKDSMILNRFNKVLTSYIYKLSTLQVAILY